jgi:two-component system NtrC family sensor kinase
MTGMATSLERVEELKRQWMAMIDAIEDPLALVGPGWGIERQNVPYHRAAQDKGKATIRDLGGRACYEVFAGRKAPCVHCKLTDALADGKPRSWSTDALVPDRAFEIRVHPMGDRAVVHYRDVTELRQMQEGLARSDKLAALGKLAGGVAHEINSPLAGILAFAQMALREMEEEDPHKQDMREIEDAARKCKVIVEGLLGFARQDKPSDASVFDAYECVRSTLRLASPMLKKNQIQLHAFLPTDGSKALIRGTPGKIDQVVLNLITNAIQAMEQGGALEVDASADARRVTIVVRDSGDGIDQAIMGRIFDPFFTTKTIGEGTGLGLSISYSILKQHGGDIAVQSQQGVGTTFTFTLPLAEELDASDGGTPGVQGGSGAQP